MIVDFPYSQPALDDLHNCLAHTSQHKELIVALKKAYVDHITSLVWIPKGLSPYLSG